MACAKGTSSHRQFGRIYLVLMSITGFTTLFMAAEVGPRFFGHLGYIHLLSILTLVTVPTAYFAAKTHRVAIHRICMIGLYFGGILIAGSFALAPGRLLHGWCLVPESTLQVMVGKQHLAEGLDPSVKHLYTNINQYKFIPATYPAPTARHTPCTACPPHRCSPAKSAGLQRLRSAARAGPGLPLC
jgi:uncharacterized membrane protein